MKIIDTYKLAPLSVGALLAATAEVANCPDLNAMIDTCIIDNSSFSSDNQLDPNDDWKQLHLMELNEWCSRDVLQFKSDELAKAK